MKTPTAFLAAVLLQVSVPSLGAAPADEAGSHVARAKAAAGSEYEVLVRALCPGQAPASDVSVRPEQRDTSVDVVPTPGHTPGTLSLIFPVHDGGARHVAAIWGGTGFNTRTQEQFSSYAESARRFAELTRTAGAECAEAQLLSGFH